MRARVFCVWVLCFGECVISDPNNYREITYVRLTFFLIIIIIIIIIIIMVY